MKEDIYFLIAFDSTHHAIQAESLLKKMGFNIKTIPTPKEITASCGLSIRFSEEYLENIKDNISTHKFSINGIYRVKKMGNSKTVIKVY